MTLLELEAALHRAESVDEANRLFTAFVDQGRARNTVNRRQSRSRKRKGTSRAKASAASRATAPASVLDFLMMPGGKMYRGLEISMSVKPGPNGEPVWEQPDRYHHRRSNVIARALVRGDGFVPPAAFDSYEEALAAVVATKKRARFIERHFFEVPKTLEEQLRDDIIFHHQSGLSLDIEQLVWRLMVEEGEAHEKEEEALAYELEWEEQQECKQAQRGGGTS